MLAEAKAYVREFTDGYRGNAAENAENRQRIKEAIEEARGGLSRHAQGVKISSDNWYQFSNRGAYAWKLVSLRVPIALIYLGFLGDEGISADPLRDHDHWRKTVREDTKEIFPSSLWERRLDINGTPLWFLIRSLPSTRRSRLAAPHVLAAPRVLTDRDLTVALGWYLQLQEDR